MVYCWNARPLTMKAFFGQFHTSSKLDKSWLSRVSKLHIAVFRTISWTRRSLARRWIEMLCKSHSAERKAQIKIRHFVTAISLPFRMCGQGILLFGNIPNMHLIDKVIFHDVSCSWARNLLLKVPFLRFHIREKMYYSILEIHICEICVTNIKE